jgi:hypothetical protein
MKSIVQIGALLVVLIGGVFGVTFLTQYTRKEVTTPTGPPPDQKDLLKVAELKAEWDRLLNIPGYQSLEMEKGTKHHYDFLIANATDKPISVILNSQFSCICARLQVSLGVLPDAARSELAAQKIFILPESERKKLPGAKEFPVGPKLEPYVKNVAWTLMEYDRTKGPSAPVTVPAADATGPRYAVLRMAWETTEIKATVLKADVMARQGSTADYRTFEVPITVTAPVLSSTNNPSAGDMLPVGDLSPGEMHENTFVVWSPTRDHFDVKAELTMPEPCIVISPPRPITGDELKQLPVELTAKSETKTLTNAKCAYQFKVQVYESKDGRQLELGPLARRVVINRGTDTEVGFGITGMVRGPMQVGRPDDRDRIDLRLFRADHGAEKMVEIKSSTPGLALTVDSVNPASMMAALTPIKTAGGTSWKLTVVVPPNTQAGPLPSDSAIYLKMNTTPPRRVRIPVVGNASG